MLSRPIGGSDELCDRISWCCTVSYDKLEKPVNKLKTALSGFDVAVFI